MTAFMVTPNFTGMQFAGQSKTDILERGQITRDCTRIGTCVVWGSCLHSYRLRFDGAVGATSVAAPSTEDSGMPLATGANDPISGRPAFPDALAGFPSRRL
jgi:hypothetical protein